ncbi:hypothetical protein RFI_31592, partial [Reticulomyxa filosa]
MLILFSFFFRRFLCCGSITHVVNVTGFFKFNFLKKECDVSFWKNKKKRDSFSCSSPFEKSKFSNINNMNNQAFQTLKELSTPLKESQCVSHKYELLICGGYEQRACYSYHTLKNEYQFICEYPRHVELYGHCVVKMVDNNNKNSNQIVFWWLRAVIGGSSNHLLFITHFRSNISVFDLNTFQFIQHDTLPTDNIQYYCF